MSCRSIALGLVLVLAVALCAPLGGPDNPAWAAEAEQTQENLVFLDRPALLRLASQAESLMNDTVEGVSGSETFIYLNTQWLQLVLNAALRQALLLEHIYTQQPDANSKSVMNAMARDANALYLSYLEYNLGNINAMIAVHAGAGDDKMTALFGELTSIYQAAANLYRDMEARRAQLLSD